MADVETVLKHLYTFISTLSKAYTDKVSTWNGRSVQNAFNWAKYAEQMHMKLKDRSFKHELESKIQDMTIHVSPPSCIQFGFNDLEKASEIMFWALIQNPYFPEGISNDLFVSYYSEHDRFTFGFDAEPCSVTMVTSEITALSVSKDVLKSCKENEQEFLLNINSQAKCLLNSVASVTARLGIVSKKCLYLNSLLGRLFEVRHGLAVIISIYIQSGLEGDEENHFINKTVFQFLSDKINSFENIPLELLGNAINLDYRFTEIFTDWVFKKASTFSLEYPDGELYTWVCNDKSVDFKTLCHYFNVLLKRNKQTKKTVTSLLENQSTNSLVNIFKDILKNLELVC